MQLQRLLAVALLAIGCAPGFAAAQADFPSKPIKIVVSFSAGGTTDVIARQIATRLSTAWKQPVIVENKPGAGGTLGTDYLVTQPVDGYTLLMSSSGPIVISPSLGKALATDPLTAIVPVILVADVANILVVSPDYKAKTVPDLVKEGKARPGELNYASTGVGTVAHLSGAFFTERMGFTATHVPYKGAEAVTDVMAGRVQFMLTDLASVRPHIDAGKLVALSITDKSALLPGVPTFAEAGYPGIKAFTSFSVLVPAKVPPPLVKRIAAEVAKAMRNPATAARLDQQALLPVFDTPEQFTAALKEEQQNWGSFIRQHNIQPD